MVIAPTHRLEEGWFPLRLVQSKGVLHFRPPEGVLSGAHEPEDIFKTTITTPFCAYTLNYSYFGFHNTGTTFQDLMDGILWDFPFCACYVVHIYVFSSFGEEHLHNLRTVLYCLQQNSFLVQYHKYTFAANEVSFFRHASHMKASIPYLRR
ncbi:uncharacterized protein [Palaemon carinicauda]|uniref:uncharacterized protein n=1 Tax=Palaemon carinicauda TaxID=392227 RepID=UPI0035B5F989